MRWRPEILFEDDEIIVVVKEAGMLVHPAPGRDEPTMTETLIAMRPKMAGVGSVERPGVVHRLDIGTSGVMVFAKTQRAYVTLRKAFESHRDVAKTYLAVVHGAIKPPKGTLDNLIGRDHKRAITHWEVLERRGSLALVEFRIETGRMHQIRIHAAQLGHPIVGDNAYGDKNRDRQLAVRPTRPLLHAVELGFRHPTTGEFMGFATPPPADIIYAQSR